MFATVTEKINYTAGATRAFTRRHLLMFAWVGFVAAVFVISRLTPDRFNFVLLVIELGSLLIVWAYSLTAGNRGIAASVMTLQEAAQRDASKLNAIRTAVFEAYLASIRENGPDHAQTVALGNLYGDVAEIVWPVTTPAHAAAGATKAP